MTVDGVMTVMRLISANYDNYHPKDLKSTTDLWLSAFSSFDDKTVEFAVKKFMLLDEKGFPPKIGQIVSIIFSEGREVMSEVEAWGYVSKALRNSTYGAEEEFENLPEIVKSAIGNAERLKEWASLDEREVQTVISSNFMRSYRAKAEGRGKIGIEGKGQEWIE